MPESPSSEIWLGLMSGTSVDSIDAVALQVGADMLPQQLLAHISHEWPQNVQRELQRLPSAPPPSWEQWLSLDVEVAAQHALAVNTLRMSPALSRKTICGVGFHGQTIFHAPASGNTLQLGSPAHLAAATGLPVVADFRRADIALGGEGAPLGPLFHEALFGPLAKQVAVLNLGGIANISVIENGQVVAGYDTGPANGLMDAWCQQHFGCAYDAGGQRARSGNVLPTLLATLLADPYFHQAYPKSTGREYFNAAWLGKHLRGDESANDVLRTLLELTVQSVADALKHHLTRRLVLVGGGSANHFLVERLGLELSGTRIETSDALGWPSQAVEGGMFAWLAARCQHKIPSDCTRITGANAPTILGAWYPPPP